MEDLLPYYERELAYLRRYSEDFAQRYPKIAGRLLPAGGYVDDPSIDQSIQAMALLDARIGKKLEDDYPQCIEALFDVLHRHYLRPFPACSIAQFTAAAADRGARPYVLERGTELVSWSVDGIQCRFKTAYDVDKSEPGPGTPVGWGDTVLAQQRGEYPNDPKARINDWTGDPDGRMHAAAWLDSRTTYTAR